LVQATHTFFDEFCIVALVVAAILALIDWLIGPSGRSRMQRAAGDWWVFVEETSFGQQLSFEANYFLRLKGGGAWGQGSSSGSVVLANGTVFETTSSSSNRSGWVIGAGVEWGFAPNWSAKIEYNHIDFGSSNVAINGTVTGISNVSSTDMIDVVKAGVNYRFNWGGPVVAKY
jgi:outer membrane autotransporter protein